MSSLRKVAEIAENSVGKGFCRLIISSDGMTVQFRSRFIFKLLASTIFEEISWFYNKRHHGKKPDGRLSGTLKNVVFRKVKSGQIVARPRTTLQKLQENLCRQLQPNIYQRKLRLKSRKIEIEIVIQGHATNS